MLPLPLPTCGSISSAACAVRLSSSPSAAASTCAVLPSTVSLLADGPRCPLSCLSLASFFISRSRASARGCRACWKMALRRSRHWPIPFSPDGKSMARSTASSSMAVSPAAVLCSVSCRSSCYCSCFSACWKIAAIWRESPS